MDLIRLANKAEFLQYFYAVKTNRQTFEDSVTKMGVGKQTWYLNGFCEICEKESAFLVDWNYSDGITPNYRERILCEYCKLNNRQRFIGGLIKRILKKESHKKIYLYEQVTHFYQFLSGNYSENISGSEYLGWDKKPGEVIDHIRHEDALNLSFENKKFDIIISNDVFEHVPDIHLALKESFRVLKNSGLLLISIPFTYADKTIQRAEIKQGKIHNIHPEVYHGNPVSEKGSLVFYDYGWDFLKFCKDKGFEDSYILGYYSTKHGHIGDCFQSMIIAEKTKGALDDVINSFME